jgi:hypothetical protein
VRAKQGAREQGTREQGTREETLVEAETLFASPSRSHARRDCTLSMKAMKSSTACRISGGHSTFSASFPSNHAELELSSPEARGSLGRRQFARRGPACTGSACGACARAWRCPACACAGAGCFCCSLQPVLTRAAELEPAGTPLPPWRRMSPAPPVHALAAATPAELGAAAGPHFLRTFYPQCLQAFPLLTCSSLKRCVLAGMWSRHRIE